MVPSQAWTSTACTASSTSRSRTDRDADPNKIYLGSAFDTANIDSATEVIAFDQAHHFISGDRVRYHRGGADGLANFGLVEDNFYYVLVIDDSHIRLVDTIDKAKHPENYFQSFDALNNVEVGNVDNNTITLNGHGFNDGDAVTYDAPNPSNFLTGMVDVRWDGALNPDGSVKLVTDTTRDNIIFLDDNGSFKAHGFNDGDLVRYTVTDAGGVLANAKPVVGLQGGDTYRVVVINAHEIQLKRNTVVDTSADFLNDFGTQKFVRNDGGSFVADGFSIDRDVTVFDASPLFNHSYDLTGVTASTLTVTGGADFQATRVRNNIDFLRGTNGGDKDGIRINGFDGAQRALPRHKSSR